MSHEPDAEEDDAYERLLSDAMSGEPFHFAREDYVEEAWRIVDPVLGAHSRSSTSPAPGVRPRPRRWWHRANGTSPSPTTIARRTRRTVHPTSSREEAGSMTPTPTRLRPGVARGRPRTLSIDIGGTGLKALVLDASGTPITDRVRVPTPRPATPNALLRAVEELVAPLGPYDRISAGFPGVVIDGVTKTAPNLHPSWAGFPLARTLTRRLGKPARVLNDAGVQGFGVIDGKDLELVLTLGTGFGSALFYEGVYIPNLELAHHPFRKGHTYEEYLGLRALQKVGKKKWNRRVARALEQRTIWNPRRIYLGGGNASQLSLALPPHVRITRNVAGLLGGIALWGTRPRRRNQVCFREETVVKPSELDRSCVNTIRFSRGRRGREGELRASRACRWARRRWRTCSGRASCGTIRRNPQLVGPRPLRAVRRARLGAAVRAAAPDRLRPDARPAASGSGSGAAGRRAIPRAHLTPGVEATTGPLGQGVGNARRHGDRPRRTSPRATTARATRSSTTSPTCSRSDGDMMEGVQSEAASLAGHLGLGRLIVLYDNNHVTLSATTPITFTEDVAARYRAYGWHVQSVDDGNDLERDRARRSARRSDDAERPSLISVRTVIGYGAPDKQGTFEAHGSPLGADEVRATKENLGWPREPPFFVPRRGAGALPRSAIERGRELEARLAQRVRRVRARIPGARARSSSAASPASCPTAGTTRCPAFARRRQGHGDAQGVGGGAASARAALPELVGGSGDLDPSTLHVAEGGRRLRVAARGARGGVQGVVGGGWGYAGRNIHFGVREHAMGAAVNGLAYHGGFIPFGATFLVFSDYMRPPIRLAALAQPARRSSSSPTTASALGEDGPTHQPVEQLAALRAIPNLLVIRPCDANETRWAWQVALEQRDRPTALVLTRQHVPTLDRARLAPAELLAPRRLRPRPQPASGTRPTSS